MSDSVAQGDGKTAEERVIAKILCRRRVGLEKYGVGVERTDLTKAQWLQHAQEEAMDLAIYLQRLQDGEETMLGPRLNPRHPDPANPDTCVPSVSPCTAANKTEANSGLII